MIIDLHNHIWPEKVAGKIADFFRKVDVSYQDIGPCSLPALLKDMDRTETDKCVVLAIALRADQVESINNWLMSIKDERIITFGAMHPDYKNYKEELKRLKDNGIKGVKFQSTWQNCYVDDDRMLRIYEAIGDDMIVFLHAGGSRTKASKDVEATPRRISRVLHLFPDLKVVAAHFGGNYMLEESSTHLVGKSLYFDTAAPPALEIRIEPAVAAQIIEAHGINKICFGTDFPLSDRTREINYIRSLPISEEAKERILWRNSAELLGLS